MISAPRPSNSVHFCLYRFSNTGTRNARVFPLPVFAAPRISFPFSASGMDFDWMSVRVLKWDASRPEEVGCERGRSEKSFISAFGSWDRQTQYDGLEDIYLQAPRLLCSVCRGLRHLVFVLEIAHRFSHVQKAWAFAQLLWEPC